MAMAKKKKEKQKDKQWSSILSFYLIILFCEQVYIDFKKNSRCGRVYMTIYVIIYDVMHIFFCGSLCSFSTV